MPGSILDEITTALSAYIANTTGVRPEKKAFRLSRSGLLSLNSFVRADSLHACEIICAECGSYTLWDTPIIETVGAENGWLLFSLSPAFFVRLCERAAALDRIPGSDYVSVRMRMLMRKGPCPCPDNGRVHAALLKSVFADDRNRFTAEDDRAILTMTHGEKGMKRVLLENSCGTAAKALLMLRSPANDGPTRQLPLLCGSDT